MVLVLFATSPCPWGLLSSFQFFIANPGFLGVLQVAQITMRFLLIFCVPTVVAFTSALLLLLAFEITSFGFNEPNYGDLLAWIYLSMVMLLTALIVFVARSWYGPLRHYPVIVGIGGLFILFNIAPYTVFKVICTYAIVSVILECRWQRSRKGH